DKQAGMAVEELAEQAAAAPRQLRDENQGQTLDRLRRRLAADFVAQALEELAQCTGRIGGAKKFDLLRDLPFGSRRVAQLSPPRPTSGLASRNGCRSRKAPRFKATRTRQSELVLLEQAVGERKPAKARGLGLGIGPDLVQHPEIGRQFHTGFDVD